jgi:ubiquinone/menaquinone biosynthesis C-methylase UbiE
MSFKRFFLNSDNPLSIGNNFRKKRMQFFESQIKDLPKPVKIIDIGGCKKFWINYGYDKRDDVEITIVNIDTNEKLVANKLKFIVADATNLYNFTENEFDVAFSNSVIEHLYNKKNQISMAKEAMRVGKYFFVQTPNKYFFIEPHYVLPFFQFLPKALQLFILTKTKLSRLKKWDRVYAKAYIDEIKLLSKNEIRELFPEADIYCEKIFFLTKSYIAHNLSVTAKNYKSH